VSEVSAVFAGAGQLKRIVVGHLRPIFRRTLLLRDFRRGRWVLRCLVLLMKRGKIPCLGIEVGERLNALGSEEVVATGSGVLKVSESLRSGGFDLLKTLLRCLCIKIAHSHFLLSYRLPDGPDLSKPGIEPKPLSQFLGRSPRVPACRSMVDCGSGEPGAHPAAPSTAIGVEARPPPLAVLIGSFIGSVPQVFARGKVS